MKVQRYVGAKLVVLAVLCCTTGCVDAIRDGVAMGTL